MSLPNPNPVPNPNSVANPVLLSAPPVAMPQQFKEDPEHVYRRQAYYDRFLFYHAGKYLRWDENDRRDVFTGYQLPLPPPIWTPLEGARKAEARRRQGHAAPPLRKFKGVRAFHSPSQTKAESAATAARETVEGANIRFRKILGWGGIGVAALYDLLLTDGSSKKIVLKANMTKSNSNALVYEKAMHIALNGCKHIVQRVVLGQHREKRKKMRRLAEDSFKSIQFGGFRGLRGDDDLFNDLWDPEDLPEWSRAMPVVREIPPLPKGAPGESADPNDKREGLDKQRDVLVLEYLQGGDLFGVLCKIADWKEASTPPRQIPNDVLWLLFNCLFKAVVAMAHPRQFAQGLDPARVNIPQQSEGLETLEFKNDPIVHFDLDASNVLVGGFDTGEHRMAPVVKVADFGLAIHFSDPKYMSDMYKDFLWDLRRQGKHAHLSPEQFTPEWNHVKDLPNKEGFSTAGNYNWWTNLYNVGQIMWSAISGVGAEYPPVAYLYRVGEETRFSYGLELFRNKDLANVDARLRRLVVQCMHYYPHERPSMQEMQDIFDERLGGPGCGEDISPDAMHFLREIFWEPAQSRLEKDAEEIRNQLAKGPANMPIPPSQSAASSPSHKTYKHTPQPGIITRPPPILPQVPSPSPGPAASGPPAQPSPSSPPGGAKLGSRQAANLSDIGTLLAGIQLAHPPQSQPTPMPPSRANPYNPSDPF